MTSLLNRRPWPFFLPFLGFMLMFVPLKSQIQTDSARLASFKEDARGLVQFLQFTLNTIGDPSTSAREKDIIIQDSYLKVFLNAKVQVEDDLVPDRSTVTNKDVQAYLKDLDFFYVRASVEFENIEVAHQVNDRGELFFLVSFIRYLQGVTLDGDTIRNSQPRFVEVNLDPESRVLKIVSMYTTRLGEEEALIAWWDGLGPAWKQLWAGEIRVNDSLALQDLLLRFPALSLRDSLQMPAAASAGETTGSSAEWVGHVSVFNGDGSTLSTFPAGNKAPVLTAALLNDLKRLVATRELDLSGIPDLDDLEPLSQFRELRILNLSGTAVYDLSPLRNLTHLEVLTCANSQVRSLEPLRYATELKELYLSHTKVTQLQPITRFSQLRILDLSNTNITDLTPLASLRQLKDLDVSGTLVTDLQTLRSLGELKRLSLSGTRVSNIQALSSLLDLRHLEMESCPVRDLSPLAACMSLRLLFLDRSEVRSLMPLSALPELSKIYCDHTMIGQQEVLAFNRQRPEVLVVYESGLLRSWWAQLDPAWQAVFRGQVPASDQPGREELQQMANLPSLDISQNQSIVTLDALAVMANLRSLRCSFTRIQSLVPLRDLGDLESLDCSHTAISDLSSLAGLSRLSSLDVSYTSVRTLDGLEGTSSLKYLQADSLQVQWLAPLDSLSRLQRISMEGAPFTQQEVSRFLLHKENVLLLYRSGKLQSWWAQLPAAWREQLTRFASLPSQPDAEALHRLTQLSSLAFQDAGALTDLSPLQMFERLRHLSMEKCMIRDLRPLAGLSTLETLILSQNPIEDLSPLSGLARLAHLQLDNTLVSELEPLTPLKQLQVLSCKGTQVKRLNALLYVNGLRQLDISNSEVKSLSPLDGLQQLTLLQCYNTRLTARVVEKFKELHPQCEVVFY